MNIDPEQTLDPTSTVPSPTNIQSSNAPLLKIVVPYKNDRGSTTLHYDDRDYKLKYARKLKQEYVMAVCLTNLFRKNICQNRFL